ncbi:MAG: hypothetical protein IJ764_02575 [Bacteroidales bacterium]|nr:hypothetical protein [Bacteroidales bacterium]
MRNYFSTLFLSALLCCACGHVEEKVSQTYADGGRQQVLQVKRNGDKEIRTGEQKYYPNGTLQYEKHFSGNHESPTGQWIYNYMDGSTFATATFDKNHPLGRDWKFYDHNGQPLFKEAYDSMKVTELSDQQTPETVVLTKGADETQYQFYSDGSLRSKGQYHNSLRQGHWVYYHANGLTQAEADYVDGKENGIYCVYRENGIPYYRGLYSDGKRTGKWEFYDAAGQMTSSKVF